MHLSWSQIAGSQVHAEEDSRPLARVFGMAFNPENGQLMALLTGMGKALAPMDIRKWEEDVLQARNSKVLFPATELMRLQQFGLRRCLISRKKVVDSEGRFLGRVRDFSIDTVLAQLLNIEVARGFLFTWGRRQFSAKHISEILDDRIVLNIDVQKPNAKADLRSLEGLPV